MFSNPVYNLPPQFNENLLSQNLAGLNLDFGQAQQDFQQQQQLPVDIGGYVPPSLDASSVQWPSPEDVDASYKSGSTAVRHYNNSTIDDYYKKFIRPITDYIPIPTNGKPTYVYQNLGEGAAAAGAPTQQPFSGGMERYERTLSI